MSLLPLILAALQLLGLRPQELEADKLGVGYLQKAGLPPHYFIEVFQIFREESGGKSDEASYFSTHPTTNERIEQIKSFYT